MFRPGLFLQAMSTGRWLIIDELNRAESFIPKVEKSVEKDAF